MDEFLKTDHGKLLANSHRFFVAADVLRESDVHKKKPAYLVTPTMHLVAHGIELLLKYPTVRDGSLEDAKSFNHDLMKLWQHPSNDITRTWVRRLAVESWGRAKESAVYDDGKTLAAEDPVDFLERALVALNDLHNAVSGYALRYVAADGAKAPGPRFLIDSFGGVAQLAMRDPGKLERQPVDHP